MKKKDIESYSQIIPMTIPILIIIIVVVVKKLYMIGRKNKEGQIMTEGCLMQWRGVYMIVHPRAFCVSCAGESSLNVKF